MLDSAEQLLSHPSVQAARELVASNPWLSGLLIMAATILLAMLFNSLVARSLASWAKKTTTDLDDRVAALLHRPIFLSVVLLGVWISLTRFDLSPGLDQTLHRLVATATLITWVVFALRLSHVILDGISRLEKRTSLIQPQTVPLFDVTLRLLLWGGAIYMLLQTWGIDLAAWMVSAGIMGIAVGFAAKDTLANLFAGIFILADAPYRKGDFIVLPSGERGEVTHIGLRSTRILTRDDIEVTVPNAIMGNEKVINESGGPWEKQRVRIQVSVAYGSDVDQVRELLMKIALDHPDLASDPEPRVRFRTFGESGLDFELLGWIEQPVLRGRVRDSLNTQVYKAFNSSGIEIPYPKRDVYLHHPPEKILEPDDENSSDPVQPTL